MEATTLAQGAPIETKDHLDLAKQYLSAKALEAISKKSNNQVIQVPGTMKAYMAIYLTQVVDSDKTEDGVKILSHALNALAENDLIHSSLCAMSSVELATMPMIKDSATVISFPMVDADRLEEAKTIVGDLLKDDDGAATIDGQDKILPEGQFYAVARFTHHMFTSASVEERLQKEIDAYLSILPKGTQLVSTKRCAITDLSVPFEVIFSNPLLKQFKQVKLDYIRMAEVVDDKFEQFNLLIGVEYIKRDGTSLKQ